MILIRGRGNSNTCCFFGSHSNHKLRLEFVVTRKAHWIAFCILKFHPDTATSIGVGWSLPPVVREYLYITQTSTVHLLFLINHRKQKIQPGQFFFRRDEKSKVPTTPCIGLFPPSVTPTTTPSPKSFSRPPVSIEIHPPHSLLPHPPISHPFHNPQTQSPGRVEKGW